jgi:hypothetical protein
MRSLIISDQMKNYEMGGSDGKCGGEEKSIQS